MIPAPAVVVFDFDPVGIILGFAVRWQYAAVAAIIFAALLLAGAIALVAERRRVARMMRDPERASAVEEAERAAQETLSAGGATGSADVRASGSAARHEALDRAAGEAPADPVTPVADDRPWPVGLRADDLLFIVAGGIAGAVVFGRLGWILLYVDYYRDHTASILDPAVGGLTLAGGVVGGVVAGAAMAAVLGAPVARWFGVAIVPLVLALGLGKLAMMLGGAGQGMPTDDPWATAFAGPGPWASLAPMIPSHPSQVYEAATSGGALLVVLLLALVPAFRRHPASLFAVGIGLWAAGRFAVAFTWRDPALVGALNGDQLVTLGIAVVSAVWTLAIAVRARRQGAASFATSAAARAVTSVPPAAVVPAAAVAPAVEETLPEQSPPPFPDAPVAAEESAPGQLLPGAPPLPGTPAPPVAMPIWHPPDAAPWPHATAGPATGAGASGATSGTGEEPGPGER